MTPVKVNRFHSYLVGVTEPGVKHATKGCKNGLGKQ